MDTGDCKISPPRESMGKLPNSNLSSKYVLIPVKAYYSSASDDEITIRENRMAYQRSVYTFSSARRISLARQSLVPTSNPPGCCSCRLVNHDPRTKEFTACLHRKLAYMTVPSDVQRDD